METGEVSKLEVKAEFNRSTETFHVVACWVGMALNLLFFISDYFVLREHWFDFLMFRVGVCVVSIFALLFRKQLKISIYTCMFILVTGISIQNAYMWSVMDEAHMQKHTFAYMALFICVGMLVLWELKLSIIILVSTILANIIFISINSTLTVEQFLIDGGLLTFVVSFTMVFLINTRYKLTYNEIKSRLELQKSKFIIEEKNQEITSSIRYAKRIQEALLPPKSLLNDLFGQNYFVYYNPRDIVSGDFYWAKRINTTPVDGKSKTYLLLVAADCTGHGVPGAFMSLIGANFLQQSSTEKSVNSPAEALDYLNRNIINTLNHGGGEKIRDGMDMAMIAIDMDSKMLSFSGANNPIYFVRDGQLEIIKPNKQAIGNINDDIQPFTNYSTQLKTGDQIYLFTDGYADQFGGPNGKKMMYKKLQNIILENVNSPMDKQCEALENHFKAWKGKYEQVDDVLVIGVKI